MQSPNPTIVTMVAIALLSAGALLYHLVARGLAWWRARRHFQETVLQRRLQKLREEMDGLKLEKRELTASLQLAYQEAIDAAALKATISEQSDELQRLNLRNKMLANEARSDPTAKTIVFDPTRGSYRWGPQGR